MSPVKALFSVLLAASLFALSSPAHAQVVQKIIHCGKCEVRSYESRGRPAHESVSRTGVCYAQTTQWLGQQRTDDNCFETHEKCFDSNKRCIQTLTR